MFHVVEDTSFARHLLLEMLHRLNCKCLSFNNAQAYIDYVNSTAYQKPIATFTDILMPEMNGYSMMDKLLKTHPTMKFVVATNEPRIRNEFAHLACFYLAKPYALDKLSDVISRLKQCHQCGASVAHECNSVGDKQAFGIKHWCCPSVSKKVHPIIKA